jgi:leucyl aminopeptidase
MQISLVTSLEKPLLRIKLYEEDSSAASYPCFAAKSGETWWKSNEELWIGVGKKPTPSAIQKAIRKVFHQGKTVWPAEICIELPDLDAGSLEAIVNGVLLGGYNIELYKTERKPISPLFGPAGQLFLLNPKASADDEAAVARAKATAEVQMRVMDLMNAPANKKNAETLAKWALESGETYQYKVNVLDQTELRQGGFFALLAVNQGSPTDAALIVTEYTPKDYQKTVVLVGKGVTFDTGGISIKPSNNLHLMKSDMGGAGAVLGAVELAARLKLPVRLIGVVPTTENCVDGKAMKPGDVIDSFSGKTIEVIDTDAEGRLILADGLSYAVRTYQPDVVIDLATLTGSIIQTLGYHAAGLFTSNDALANALEEAGKETNERLWRLPLWDDYSDEVKSDIADVKNFHGKPLAGAIVAAKFLEVFTDAHEAWAHLDIAGTAFGDTDYVAGRAGTAYGIRLLRNYLEKIVSQ